ncbi:uncharacterized protein BcabD6B2_56790 [Babesia caballi]|uniref:Uncharacterized protein n=1 Tax=Babesia caballi TaxID=5871 RepID=A0AAV4M2P0_BABCB|nr:hypothetical protein BcabD6B2_56790 [Babesia caballi]
MMSVWAKLWDDVTYSHQKCNDRDGVLYKLFTSVVDIHEKEKCPYKTLKKLEIGLSQDDMRSNSRGVDVEDAIKSLVWPTGGLWALISLIKKNRFVSAPLPLYASIGTLNPSRTPCKCIEPKVEVIKTTIHSGYGSNRQTSSVRSAGGNATTIRGRTRRSTVSPSVTTTPKPIANPDVSTVTHTHGSFTASSITAGKPAATDITTSSANNYSMSNNTYNYESYTGVAGGSNNTLYLHDPNYASYSSHPTSTLQETRIQEISSGVLDSNSTACGAAAGLLAVGCVGVGAAYVFDIGGFGTMVNGMF